MNRDDLLGWLCVVLVMAFFILWFWAMIWGPLKACYNGDPIAKTPNYCMMGRR